MNNNGLHISQIEFKTAKNIVESQDEIEQDEYHNAIIEGARVILSNGYPLAEYITSYGSGSSRWQTADGDMFLVNRKDWIE